MLQFPDHVGKSLLMKIEEYNKLGKEKNRHIAIAMGKQQRQDEIMGEIKGMLQAEEYENERRKTESKPE